MKPRCVGFVHSQKYDALWSACARAPLRGDRFCAKHREAIDAGILAIFMNGFSDEDSHAASPKNEKERAIRQQSRKAKAARRASSRCENPG